MASLDDCVRRILCAFGSAAILALDSALTTLVATIDAQVAIAEAQLAVVDLILLPIQAAQEIVARALELARSSARLLPLDLIQDCTPLGDLNLNALSLIDRETAAVSQFLDDLNRMLSVRDDLTQFIEQLLLYRDLIDQVRAVVAACPEGGPTVIL